MAKGRKKLPDNITALRGTDQPCRMENKIATLPTQTLITLPKSGLKGTAKKIFAIVATELIYNNILDHLGVDLVIAYCREMALYHDMMKDLEKEGYTVKVATKTGFITQVNPKRKIAESALSAAKALAVEFGMTPSSRNRVAALLSGNEPKDDFERSFFKYKCFCEYCYYKRKWMIPIYNLGAMVIYPFIYARFVKKGRARTAPVNKVDSVIENVPRLRNDDVIPQELKDIAGKTVELEALDYKNGCLTEQGIQICKELRKRYFWHFYFRTIVTIRFMVFPFVGHILYLSYHKKQKQSNGISHFSGRKL